MRSAVIALTKNGTELALRLGRALDADIYAKGEWLARSPARESGRIHPFVIDFRETVKQIFFDYEAIVFIMACGIVVRSIAPYLKDKRSDPAVVVVDEVGRFAISLLSGHIGGANRLAEKVAAILEGTAVITTATDINGVVAFDELAAANGCRIENIEDLKSISSELVNGGRVSFFCDGGTAGSLPPNIDPYSDGAAHKLAVVVTNSLEIPVRAEKILWLRPANLTLGLGCRKGKTKGEIEEAIRAFLQRHGKSILSVRCVASIALKAGEPGIVEFCKERGIPFRTFTAAEIAAVEDRFSGSEFVRTITGVGSVAEACAALAAANGKLIVPKTIGDGITLALAETEQRFTFAVDTL